MIDRRFLVKPSETRDFVKAFLKVREEVREEKGNLIYGLSKTLTDNLTFYAYAGAHTTFCKLASTACFIGKPVASFTCATPRSMPSCKIFQC